MQLKSTFLILIILQLCSCEAQKTEEETLVISEIYNEAIIKELPPPPPPVANSELGSMEDNVDFSNLKPLTFKYAINKRFINANIKKNLNNIFRKFKSKKLFDNENLSDQEMKLIHQLSDIDNSGLINDQLITNKGKQKLLFLKQDQLSKEDKKKYKIDGVISFSKVAFDDDLKKAAVAVSEYRGKLDSNYILYVLENINNEWKIKYYKVLSKS